MRPRLFQILLVPALIAVASVPSAVSCADAPQGRYTIPAAGTVRDTKTGLTWQQTVDGSTRKWADAKTYCEGLQLQGGGWRLPSIKELQTLVDRRKKEPAIDTTFFANTVSQEFWSLSTVAGFPTGGFYVDFQYGSTSYVDINGTFWVRCVR